MPTETTPLNPIAPGPSYMFAGTSPRIRRKQMRQFQCCIFTIFLGIIVFALIIALSYSNFEEPVENTTTIINTDFNISDDDVSTLLPDPLNSSSILAFLIDLKQPLMDEKPTKWQLTKDINLTDIAEAENYGIQALGDRELLEERMPMTPINSPAFRYFRSTTTTPDSRKLAKRGYVEYHATFHLARKFNYTKPKGRSDIGIGPFIVSLTDPTLNFTCNFNSKYRTANGICNNKQNPRTYGAAMNPFRRAVRPDYGDGIATPRISHSGNDLPSARIVSLKMHRPQYSTDPNFTVMLAVFGQFLDHDITATALTSAQDGEPINCCTEPLTKHPECFPVPIVAGDPYFDQYNVTCMNFVRSAAAPTGRFGPREQLNQATAFIDGSVVYGYTEERQKMLRTNKNGTLRMFITPDNRELLPLSTNPNDGCNREEMNQKGKYCFESGDDRSNENLLLTSMHLLFARHHNTIARNLQAINPSWKDEKIFQESRKILGAQMQHITFNEFLPILLGKNFIETKIDATNNEDNLNDTYNSDINPTIANHFASFAFRFAHTLLPSLLRMTRDNSTPQSIELHTMLFNPYSLWADKGIDNAIDTAVNTPVYKVSRFFSKELTEKLFEGTAEDKVPLCGLDLVSLNIQRGRDHGLPSYPVFRRHCNLPAVDTWEQMAAAVDPESLRSLREIYESPDDVDVYTGALSEPPLENAIFGPLLACLVSDQFLRLKIGDSHWYERRVGPQRFTSDQLDEIRKTTLASIICTNSDNVTITQKFVMERQNNSTNPYVQCNDIMVFNYGLWSTKLSTVEFGKISVSQADTLVTVLTSNKSKLNYHKKPLNK